VKSTSISFETSPFFEAQGASRIVEALRRMALPGPTAILLQLVFEHCWTLEISEASHEQERICIHV
jgi:hypothetical protein